MTSVDVQACSRFICSVFMLLLAAAGCASTSGGMDADPGNGGGEIAFSAKVRWIPLEGGFYGLVTEDGRRFLPLHLPEEFRRDGLAVQVRGKPVDMATVRMWGRPIEIKEIKISEDP